MSSSANIITVGGGKGGIGKSIVCTNLALGLALSGQKVVLMDADYGASNLHALLGISNPQHGFQDFFTSNSPDPKDLLIDTGISNLKFVSGAGDNPGSSNIDNDKIETILSFVRNLEADSVLIDLGPGTSFNVIDIFNINNQSVVLTTPEITSVMKTFSFIRAALFRRISRKFKGKPKLQRLVDHSHPTQADIETYTVALLKEKLEKIAPDQVEVVDAEIKSFVPGLVVNRVRSKRDIRVGDNLNKLVKKYLEMETQYLGYIIESDRVRDSVDEMIPFLIKDPRSKPSENLQQIIGALTHTDIHLVKQDGKIFVSKQVRLTSGWEV